MNTKTILVIIILISISVLLGAAFIYTRYKADMNIEQTITNIYEDDIRDGQNGGRMPLLGIDYELAEINGYDLISVNRGIEGDPINVGYSLAKYKSDEYEIAKNPYTGEDEKLFKEFYLRFYPKNKNQTLSQWISATTSSVNCTEVAIGNNLYFACEELGIVDGSVYYIEDSDGVYEFYLGILGLNEDTRKVLESFYLK